MPGDSPSIESIDPVAQVKSGYAAPANLGEALALLATASGSAVIAGGTDLAPAVRAGRLKPELLIDLRRLPLNKITVEQDYVHVGARVTFTDILRSSQVASEFPALSAAAAEVGGLPIRNRATIGGNLVNASPAADGAPPLLAYDASVVVAGPEGQREIPLVGFFKGPGQTVLGPGEILTEVLIPRPRGPNSSAFVKLGPRLAMAVAIVSVAVRVTGDGAGGVAVCRIGLGAVAPTPMRAEAAEGIVAARGLTDDAIKAAAGAAAQACSPIDDIRGTAGYRRQMVEVQVDRLLRRAAAELPRGDGNG
jgi:carbon-monoxide dehydrogenase medium subunit